MPCLCTGAPLDCAAWRSLLKKQRCCAHVCVCVLHVCVCVCVCVSQEQQQGSSPVKKEDSAAGPSSHAHAHTVKTEPVLSPGAAAAAGVPMRKEFLVKYKDLSYIHSR